MLTIKSLLKFFLSTNKFERAKSHFVQLLYSIQRCLVWFSILYAKSFMLMANKKQANPRYNEIIFKLHKYARKTTISMSATLSEMLGP